MRIHQVRFLIIIALVLFVTSSYTAPSTSAEIGYMRWDLEAGTLFPCRFITGDNETGALDLGERTVYLRVENTPDDLYNVVTWDDIPDVNVSIINTNGNGIDYDPDSFEYIILEAGLTWTGHDWFKPAIPAMGVNEDTWNAVYEELMETWVGPWGSNINVSILPDPYYEVYTIWDQTFWAVQYNFTYNGVFYDVMASYWLYPSWLHSPYNSGLLQNVTITGEDATSGEIMNFFQLICDPSPPHIWNHAFIIYPEDGGRQSAESINYTVGDTQYAIYWNIKEDLPVDYIVYDNYTVFASGPVNFTHYGAADDHIELSLDGLDAGVHNFTIIVSNSVGSTGSYSFILTVADSSWFPVGLTPEILIVSGVGIMIVLVGVAVYLRRRG